MAMTPIGGGGRKPPLITRDMGTPIDVPASPSTSVPTKGNRSPDVDAFVGSAKIMTQLPGASAASSGVIHAGLGSIIGLVAQRAKDTQRLTDMRDLLADSPTGVAALKFLDDKSIKVEFASGGGSYWDADANKMVIDRTASMEDNALTLVHEINHARASHSGSTADAKTHTREGFIDKMLNEEVQGAVDAIKAKNELVAAGKTITARRPQEEAYNAAYAKCVKDMKKATPTATDAELHAAGEKAGALRVKQGFKDGDVVTSTTIENYPQFYSRSWDRVHAGVIATN